MARRLVGVPAAVASIVAISSSATCDGRATLRAGREEVQDVGGDGEADQPWDRGRQQRDRALGGLLARG